MSPRENRAWSLVGVRAPADDHALGCRICRGVGAPAILLLSRTGGADWGVEARLCLPCIAKAVEAATGWKVTRAWAQWLSSSLQAQTHRTNKEEPSDG